MESFVSIEFASTRIQLFLWKCLIRLVDPSGDAVILSTGQCFHSRLNKKRKKLCLLSVPEFGAKLWHFKISLVFETFNMPSQILGLKADVTTHYRHWLSAHLSRVWNYLVHLSKVAPRGDNSIRLAWLVR